MASTSELQGMQDCEVAVHIGSLRPAGDDGHLELQFASRRYRYENNLSVATMRAFLMSEIQSATGMIFV